MNIKQAEDIISSATSELAGRFQENLGNRISSELANGFLMSIRSVLAAELGKVTVETPTEEVAA